MNSLVHDIRATPGYVYLPRHPYYGWLAGEPMMADWVSITDAEHASRPVAAQLRTEVETLLDSHRICAIVLDDGATDPTLDSVAATTDLKTFYSVGRPLPGVTMGVRPDWWQTHAVDADGRPACKP